MVQTGLPLQLLSSELHTLTMRSPCSCWSAAQGLAPGPTWPQQHPHLNLPVLLILRLSGLVSAGQKARTVVWQAGAGKYFVWVRNVSF